MKKIYCIIVGFLLVYGCISNNVQSTFEKASTAEGCHLNYSCKILFIGSSYFNYNNLPGLFRNLAIDSGKEVYIGQRCINGWYLDNHADDIKTESKINEQEWDYVILQGVGSNMAYPDYFTDHPAYPALVTLHDKIIANCEYTKMIFCMPWAFEDGMTWYKDWTDTYKDMQIKIFENTLQYSNKIGFEIAPVGWAWYNVLEEKNYPLHYLHMLDWNHPSLKGSYLMACVIFSTVFLESSISNPYYGGLSEEEATYFQVVASDTVLNDLDLWNIVDDSMIYVDDSNTDGPWDGTHEYPYQHIQNAIDNTPTDGTVFVFNGVYYEHLNIDKSIILRGEYDNATIIDGNRTDGNVIDVYADNVTITGFTIQYSGKQKGDSGIKLHSNYNTIEDNIIRKNGWEQSYFKQSGLYLDRCTHNTIVNNTIEDNIGSGIYLYHSDNNTIQNNTICKNNVSGMIYNASSYNKIIHNNVYENYCGVAFKIRSDYNIIRYNRFTDNLEWGIMLGFGPTVHNVVEYNTISGTTGGQQNWFEGSGLILSIAFYNTIGYNNFVGNKYDVYLENSLFNLWYQNYWENRTGSGVKIIQGHFAKPYTYHPEIKIPWFAVDWNPATEPYDW